MLMTTDRPKDKKQRNRQNRPTIPWDQVEELVNLAKNKLKITSDNQLGSELGLGQGTIGTWRRTVGWTTSRNDCSNFRPIKGPVLGVIIHPTVKERDIMLLPRERKRIRTPETEQEAYRFKPKVEIDEWCLKYGEPKTAGKCMCALAVKLSIPGARSLVVSVEMIRFTYGVWRYTYDVPVPLARMIAAFDDSKARNKLTPATFKLQNPSIRPFQPSLTARKPKDKSGKYVGVSKKRHCSRRSAKRSHGVRLKEYA